MIMRTPPGPASAMSLACLSLAMLLPSLATSIVNAALPALAQALDASFAAVQWVILSYLLALTMLTVIVGRLGDLMGRRRSLLVGIGLFTFASLLCAAALSVPMLIAARIAQGAGAAVMLTLGMTFVGDVVPRERTGSAMGLLGTMSAAGTMLGPALGGFLIGWGGWTLIFLVNVPLGLAALLLAWRGLPGDASSAGAGQRFDHLGMVLLGVTLASYALAMTLGRARFGPLNVGLLIVAAIGVAAFLRAEAKAQAPLIRLGQLHDPALAGGLAMSALVSTVMMATLVVGPFYLSRALGFGSAQMGLLLSAGPLVAALTGLPAGRLADRFGAARMGSAGLIAMAIGSGVLALLAGVGGVAGYVAPIILMTSGYALFQAANNSAVMVDARPEERGVRSGMLGLSRNLGLVAGASAMGALFLFGTGSADIGAAAPDAVAAGVRLTFAVSAGLILVALAVAARMGRAGPVRRPACARPC
jgi:MFS family permease